MRIFAVYFSGTGNTQYAVERFLAHSTGSEGHSIEENMDFDDRSRDFNTVLVAYPIYGSDMPLPMKEFLDANKAMFSGKNLITLATQYLFSGDGGALAYRLLKNEVHMHIASIHIKMPTNVNLSPLLCIKNGWEIEEKIEKANQKIDRCAHRVKNGGRIRDGKGPIGFLAGYLFQRLWFRLFIFDVYKARIKIDREKCIKCSLCIEQCPADNLKMEKGIPNQQGRCVLCYRCINLCPTGAITLFSKKDAKVQYSGIGNRLAH